MLDTLKHKSVEDLQHAREELWHVWGHLHTPKNVKDAAAVLYNFYGAEIDARMMAGEGK
jgi:hypothetical protein